jgi:peptidoglycan/LPS O-acetylase OafA/YrhL
MMKNVKLELVRGIAALIVFVSHSGNISCLKGNVSLNFLTNWGTESVLIFFILSGIVINMSQKKKTPNFSKFLKNRILRLYPIYLVSIMFSVFVAYLLNENLSNSMIAGNLFFLGTLQNYIVGVLPTNGAIWSLSFEFFFYVLFAISIRKHHKEFMLFWLIVSFICIPVYYLQISGLFGHIMAMFAFSSIWLAGYFIYEYRRLIKTPNLFTVIFFTSLLPGISRLQFFDIYYDICKYLIFAIFTVPLFIYCLGNDEKYNQNQSNRIVNKFDLQNLQIKFISLMFLILTTIFCSKALIQNRIIYVFIPSVFFFFSFFPKLTKLFNTIQYNTIQYNTIQ